MKAGDNMSSAFIRKKHTRLLFRLTKTKNITNILYVD